MSVIPSIDVSLNVAVKSRTLRLIDIAFADRNIVETKPSFNVKNMQRDPSAGFKISIRCI